MSTCKSISVGMGEQEAFPVEVWAQIYLCSQLVRTPLGLLGCWVGVFVASWWGWVALYSRRSRHRHTPCLWLPLFLRAFSPRGVPSGKGAPPRHRPVLVNLMCLLRRGECGRGRVYCSMALCSPDTEWLAGSLHREPTLSSTDWNLASQPYLVIHFWAV